MSFQNTHQAILDKFESEWGASTPVDYGDDEAFEKPSDSYVKLTVLFNPEQRAALSEELFRATGIIVIKIFTRLFESNANRMVLVDQVAAIFRSQTFDGVSVYSIDPKNVGTKDGWHQTHVNISFESDHSY